MVKYNSISDAIDNYYSAHAAIWHRCKEVAEKYYEAGIYIRGIHHISNFEIDGSTITIYEGAQCMDIELPISAFVDDNKLAIAISKDIQEYLENN